MTVQPGATVNGIFPSNAIEISTTPPFAANQLINNGTINGFVVILSAGPGVDSFTNNGILTVTDPNAPLQTHSMFGSAYIQSAAGTLFARVDANGFNDGIFAWNAVLSGKLAVVIQPGTYVTPIQYSIIQAFTGFTGQFTSLTFSSPFFTGTIDPSGGDDVLTLNAIPFNAVAGLTRNQQAVANALQAAYLAGPTGDAATFFANLFAAGSVGVFDQISGEGTAALQNASFAAGSQFNYAALNQLLFGDASGTTSVIIPPSQYAATSKPRGADAFASVLKAPPAPATQVGRWRLWTVGFGGYRSIDGNAFPIGSANQTIRNYGGALGADYQLAPDLLVGFAAGGSGASVSVPDRATTGDLTGGHFGLYGLKTWGPGYAAASVNYARFDNSTNRTITGLGPTERAQGNFASDQVSARLELGWKKFYGQYTVTPFVAIEPALLHAHSYTENSATLAGAPGILGLSFAARNTSSLPTFIGAQADTRIAFHNGAVMTPYLRASWVHEFEPTRQIAATFISIPSAAFVVDGARPASDSGRLDAGAKVALDSTRMVFANFSGEWSGISQSYTAMAGFKLTR